MLQSYAKSCQLHIMQNRFSYASPSSSMTCSPSFCVLLLFTHCDTAMLCRTCWYGGSGGLSSGGRVTRSLCSTAQAAPSSLTLPTHCAAPGMTCWPGMSCPSLPLPVTAFALHCLCLSLPLPVTAFALHCLRLSLPLPFTAFACHCLCPSLPLPVTAFALHCLRLSLPLPFIAFDLPCLCPSLPLPLTAFVCHCLRPFLVLLSHCRCRGLTHAKEYAEEGCCSCYTAENIC